MLAGAASISRAQVTLCLQVVDQAGEEHEVLLRHWTSSNGLRMYMLERTRPLLEAGSAREGFKLQLQHEEGQPMVSTGEGWSRTGQCCWGSRTHSPSHVHLQHSPRLLLQWAA